MNTPSSLIIAAAALLLFVLIVLMVRAASKSQERFAASPPVVTFTSLGNYGRLGNQLFQIAAVQKYAKECRARPVLPTSARSLQLFKLFDLPCEFEDVPPTRILHEKGPTAMEKDWPVLRESEVLDLKGYFQHQAFLDGFEMPPLSAPMKQIADRYAGYIAIHVRRGDYVNLPMFSPIPADWFRTALEQALDHCGRGSGQVVVVSDDIPWCRENLNVKVPGIEVHFSDQPSEIEDFAVIAGSRAAIISNSSFAWWAAHYGQKQAVYMPWPWFTPGHELEPWNLEDALIVPQWKVQRI